jgi:hypothetical protein
MLRCSVNGLPVHARLPHRISRAYQRVQQWAADLADLRGPEGGFDGPADIPEVAHPGGYVPPGCRHVLVEQLGDGDVRVGLPPGLGHREQLAELDLRRPFGLTCPPQPDLTARQRVDPGVYLHAPGSAGESLYVSGPAIGLPTAVYDPVHGASWIAVELQVGRVGLEPTTGGL